MKRLLAPLGAAGVLLLKYGVLFLKVALPLLKTGGTMFVFMWFYAMQFGWAFAAGFTVLIFVHECGHLIAAKRLGLRVGAPMFIPFLGALIMLKEAPRNAWIEAQVGIGGPLLGSLGAAVCQLIYIQTGHPLYCGLAFTGYFLNLFNLAPVGPLDGGRVVTALSPWLWVVGYTLMVVYTVVQVMAGHFNIILLLIIVFSTPRLLSLFRARTDEEKRYFEVTPPQRWAMGLLYFGLMFLLVIGMRETSAVSPLGQ